MSFKLAEYKEPDFTKEDVYRRAKCKPGESSSRKGCA